MAGRAPASTTSGGKPEGRFAVVAARFNEPISKKLADGAVAALESGGVAPERIETHWVPGSFELPLAAMTLARTRRYAGIVCVGVVIRGETPHFEFVAGEAARGVSTVALTTGVPVTFGVITSLTEAQAWERAGGVVGHRGEEAARAALAMAQWKRELQAPRRGRRAAPRRA
ncbi:MAG TPA: 6,7-dimethyl-8-ribityllumazine synthase [Candidatus Bathyarchaeia archaeon]|nr:6,7-dimethyl-8-ribityllumazine synthase [Candidatus Bathyarchaeia archaeon]